MWSSVLHSALQITALLAIELLVRSLVGMFLQLSCIVQMETSNGLMPAGRELLMLSMPGVEHAMLNIGGNLCLLMLRPTGYIVLQGIRIFSTPGIL